MNDRHLLLDYWLEQAHCALAAARREFGAGDVGLAANRIYYAAFYAATAAIAAQGRYYRRHQAVRAAIHRDYVRIGRLSADDGRLYDLLFSNRQQCDYAPFARAGDLVSPALLIDGERLAAALERLAREDVQGYIAPSPGPSPGVEEPAAAGSLHLQPAEAQALAEIKQAVTALVAVERYVLFGSKARGDSHAESDVDLLVITREPLSGRQRSDVLGAVFDANLTHGTLVSAVIIDAATWESPLGRVMPLRAEVERDGVRV